MESGIYLLLNHNQQADETFLLYLAKLAEKYNLPALQLRSKNISDRKRLDFAYQLRTILKHTPFFINDRADIALLAKADGIHIGLDDISPTEARVLLNKTLLLGASSHNRIEVEAQSADNHLNYIAFGPTFDSRSKQGHAKETGLSELEEICKISSLPVCAIGGLNTPEHFFQVAKSGASLAASISAIEKAKNPEEFLKEIIEAFKDGKDT